jgi:hypothetical protein
MDQAGIKVLSRRAAAVAAGAEHNRHVMHEAAALHYLRTGEEVINMHMGASYVEVVMEKLQREEQGTSACNRCIEGDGCTRAANREASRCGKLGAIWAEEAGQLVGREFRVCSLRSILENAR